MFDLVAATHKALDDIVEHCDCIILPGGACDDDGIPVDEIKRRCDAEVFLKTEMLKRGRYVCTIVSGGDRGVAKFINKHNAVGASEASRIIDYAVTDKALQQSRATYVPEVDALETIGNLVFSTKHLLERDLTSPVFVSQKYHLWRLKTASRHWYGHSGISPRFWVAVDAQQQLNEQRLNEQLTEALLENYQGYDFIEAFREGTIPLPFRWTAHDNNWAFEVAIRWLFQYVLSRRDGPPRYPADRLQNILMKYLAVPKNTPE